MARSAFAVSPLGETDRARAEGEREGLVKIIASPNGRLLGAAICGKAAGEMIPLWTLALKEKMKLSKIAELGDALSDAERGLAARRARVLHAFGATPLHASPAGRAAQIRIAMHG